MLTLPHNLQPAEIEAQNILVTNLFTGDRQRERNHKEKGGARFPELRRGISNGLVAVRTTAAAAVLTTTAAAALFTRFGLVDGEGAAIHICAVQSGNSFLRFLGCAHGHETKTAGFTGHAIHQQVGFGDRAMRGERVLQVIFGGVKAKIPNKYSIIHVMFYCPTNCDLPQTVPEHRV